MRELVMDKAGSSQQIPAVVGMRVAPQFDVLVLFSTGDGRGWGILEKWNLVGDL